MLEALESWGLEEGHPLRGCNHREMQPLPKPQPGEEGAEGSVPVPPSPAAL